MKICRHFPTTALVPCHILCILQEVNPKEWVEEKLRSTHSGQTLLPMTTFDFVLNPDLRCVDKRNTVSLGVVTCETTALIGSIVRFAGWRENRLFRRSTKR